MSLFSLHPFFIHSDIFATTGALSLLVFSYLSSNKMIDPQSAACLTVLPKPWLIALDAYINFHSDAYGDFNFLRYCPFCTIKGSPLLTQGMPKNITLLHNLSLKSIPSLSLARQTQNIKAPLPYWEFYTNRSITVSRFFLG